ncbi:MAG: aminotransferase class I/II-fold pyridoxal phosphate-dependent enzyme, partial [Myxococcota bacterium]
MTRINENYSKLQAGYLFPEIARRVGEFSAANPDAKIIRLGIGDITLPLAPALVEALRAAADEMGRETSVHGYGPENGYDFLIEAICEHDYKARGVDIAADEVFVSDGSKQDSGNIQEIFGANCRIAVTDPCYPVYVDTNVMAGRTGDANPNGSYEGILYLPATEANDFAPPPPEEPVDLVYLCSPNNPTGSAASRANLTAWVTWARQHDSVLIFDAAYDAFIQDDELP